MKVDDNYRFFGIHKPTGSKTKPRFRAQALGEHTIRKEIQKEWAENEKVGLGDKNGIRTHSFHGTVATFLL